MKTKSRLYLSVAAVAVTAFLSAPSAQLHAQQAANPAIHVGANDIGGVVTGPTGPEAGVWVIAETTELGTKMAKMVVTDDQGRYVMPDLPKANYDIWVRGYGLVDSPKVQSAPGKMLNLTATPGQLTAAQAQSLSTARTAFSVLLAVGNNTVAWNPTVVVTVPASAVAGTYTGTITHSVA